MICRLFKSRASSELPSNHNPKPVGDNEEGGGVKLSWNPKLRNVYHVKLIGGVTSVPGTARAARGETLIHCRVLELPMKKDELLGTTFPGTDLFELV